jgi:VanZ family protein
MYRFIKYWLPPIAWMILIFVLSARQRIPVSDSYTVSFIIFKTLHIIEYATLYFLLFRAFHSQKNMSMRDKYLYPFIIAVIYAASDELHQTFVPTREGKPRDVVIDCIGITLMYSYIRLRLSTLKRLL